MCVWQNLQQQGYSHYRLSLQLPIFNHRGFSTTICGIGVLHSNTTSLHYGTSVGGLNYMLVEQCTAVKAGEIFYVVKTLPKLSILCFDALLCC